MSIETPLVGWGEIATAIGEASADMARKKYKRSIKTDHPMPVIKNGRVKAYPSDLRDWLSSLPAPSI